jgi:pyridinium-3,5-bisthiocarboxylic acid mononucleotide nickel chelatase
MARLVLDARRGIAGDMVVGALVGLGAPAGRVARAMEAAGSALDRTRVRITRVERGGVGGVRVDVQAPEGMVRSGAQLLQAMDVAVRRAGVDRALPEQALRNLLQAEAEAHGVAHVEDLHLHETGSADTLADLCGAAAALEMLRLRDAPAVRWPAAVGWGEVRTAHGLLPVPAPAVAHLLGPLGWERGPCEGELATPTGAALLRALAPAEVGEERGVAREGRGFGGRTFAQPTWFRAALER